MPLGKYNNFEECVSDQLSRGYSKKQAGAICGLIEKRSQMSKVDKGETVDIRKVPIMKIGDDVKGLKIDKKWMEKAIDIHNKNREEGYIPTVFIGHNNDYDEKPAEAFLDNLEYSEKDGVLYADIMDLEKEKESMLKSFPYRSVEIFTNYISGLALLGSNAPFFKLPALLKEDITPMEFIYQFNQKDMAKLEEKETQEVTDETTEEVEVKEEEKEEIKEEEIVVEDKDGEEVVLEEEEKEEPVEEEKVVEEEKTELSEKVSLQEQLNSYKQMTLDLKAKLEEKELREQITKFTASEDNVEGKLTPLMSEKALNLCQKMDINARNEFFAFLNEMPSLAVNFQEIGHSEEVTPENKEDAFIEEVNKHAKENNVTIAEATKELSAKL